jgi:hypothetical protein
VAERARIALHAQRIARDPQRRRRRRGRGAGGAPHAADALQLLGISVEATGEGRELLERLRQDPGERHHDHPARPDHREEPAAAGDAPEPGGHRAAPHGRKPEALASEPGPSPEGVGEAADGQPGGRKRRRRRGGRRRRRRGSAGAPAGGAPGA